MIIFKKKFNEGIRNMLLRGPTWQKVLKRLSKATKKATWDMAAKLVKAHSQLYFARGELSALELMSPVKRLNGDRLFRWCNSKIRCTTLGRGSLVLSSC